MKQFYQGLNEDKKVMFLTLISCLLILLVMIPLCFFKLWDIPLGFILGVGISIANYALLTKQCDVVVYDRSKWIFVLFYLLRFALYFVGLLIALLLLQYHIKLFNVFSVFGGYFPLKIIVIILGRR